MLSAAENELKRIIAARGFLTNVKAGGRVVP